MRRLSWIILLPLAAAVIAFSVANRSPMVLDLWPLPFTVELPVYGVVLASAAAGFVIGGVVAWLSTGGVRRRARDRGFEAQRAQRELRRMQDKMAGMEADGARNVNVLPAPTPAP